MKNVMRNMGEHMQEVRLTNAEKDAMRLALHEHMRNHPLPPTKTPVPSPFFVRHHYLRQIAVSACAVLLLSAGSTYAAEDALPGDVLYPVKVRINEPVVSALSVSAEKRARTEASFAERRVSEAEALAAQGALDPETSVRLEEDFSRHAARAVAFAEKIPVTPTAPVSEATTPASQPAPIAAKSAVSREDHAAPSLMMMSSMAEDSGLEEEELEKEAEEPRAEAMRTVEHPRLSEEIRASLDERKRALEEIRRRAEDRSKQSDRKPRSDD